MHKQPSDPHHSNSMDIVIKRVKDEPKPIPKPAASSRRDKVLLEGYLHKRGIRGLFTVHKKMYFQLYDTDAEYRFVYYRSKEEASPGNESGYVDTASSFFNLICHGSKPNFEIEIEGRTYYLRAESTAEGLRWMNELKRLQRSPSASGSGVKPILSSPLGISTSSQSASWRIGEPRSSPHSTPPRTSSPLQSGSINIEHAHRHQQGDTSKQAALLSSNPSSVPTSPVSLSPQMTAGHMEIAGSLSNTAPKTTTETAATTSTGAAERVAMLRRAGSGADSSHVLEASPSHDEVMALTASYDALKTKHHLLQRKMNQLEIENALLRTQVAQHVSAPPSPVSAEHEILCRSLVDLLATHAPNGPTPLPAGAVDNLLRLVQETPTSMAMAAVTASASSDSARLRSNAFNSSPSGSAASSPRSNQRGHSRGSSRGEGDGSGGGRGDGGRMFAIPDNVDGGLNFLASSCPDNIRQSTSCAELSQSGGAKKEEMKRSQSTEGQTAVGEGGTKRGLVKSLSSPIIHVPLGDGDGCAGKGGNAHDPRRILSQKNSVPNSFGAEIRDKYSVLRALGQGAHGQVWLVREKESGALFAMKCVKLTDVKPKRLATEVSILQLAKHPFITNLHASLEDSTTRYLVMEFCAGGDFHSILTQHGRGYRELGESMARFYAAEVALALEFLHTQGFIYRDLKPENILFHESGHIRLSDFGLSKAVKSTENARIVKRGVLQQHLMVDTSLRKRSYSVVGSEYYVAPEILRGKGHNSSADWWSFGVLIYNMVYGRPPFQGAVQEKTFQAILHDPLLFPKEPLISMSCRDIITRLLDRNVARRLGSNHGASEIRAHPFFRDIRWALISNTRPPLRPHIPEGIVSLIRATRSEIVRRSPNSMSGSGPLATAKQSF
eukprot:TRINITY_DN3352_c0_g5_i3.p1 TRINITY_DN3352_c0_g5~~TRINITY_DN3352_c0_g5_i3.p1  ORF type:complete len:893 (+),score=167.67 TRINITY_DN3352_c0_g5_i3:175-2853(+)